MKPVELIVGAVTVLLFIISFISGISRLFFSNLTFFFSSGSFLISGGCLLILLAWNRRKQTKANKHANSSLISKAIGYGLGGIIAAYGVLIVYRDVQ